MLDSEVGAERGTLGSLSLCEQEETGPAAPQLWWEINQTNRLTIWISTLGEGARQQAQGQEGNAKAFYHLNNFPWACFHPNVHSVLRLFFLNILLYFDKCSDFPATNYSWPGYKLKGCVYPSLDKKAGCL